MLPEPARQGGLLYDRWRHHRSPPPQFWQGTGGEGNILQPPALVVSAETAYKTFEPTNLTIAYSVRTWRVFGGIEPRPFDISVDEMTPEDYLLAYHENNYVPLRNRCLVCQVIYSQFGLAIHQNDHQARRRFVEWAQNEIAVVPDFHNRILFSYEAHFWLNGYVNKQNCRIWSEANPQVYVETPLHPEKLTVWCALWAGGILQKR
ncbi:uncharacterized protein TNCV_2891151 [Trichonephila clavipes]|nr:uncharacterized protein TNCV_2891151 [Trichonephila clavipes]